MKNLLCLLNLHQWGRLTIQDNIVTHCCQRCGKKETVNNPEKYGIYLIKDN